MKKLLNVFASLGVALSLLAGCATIQKLTPAQVNTIAVVITQTADQGALYAIQQDSRNASYFKLANATIDTFVLGTDLSPANLQAALATIPGASNQWINLAVSAVVVAYDVSYQQYVADQLTNSPAAVVWITAVETGFRQALAQTGTALVKKGTQPTPPYFVKVDGKTLDKAAVKAKVKAARK